MKTAEVVPPCYLRAVNYSHLWSLTQLAEYLQWEFAPPALPAGLTQTWGPQNHLQAIHKVQEGSRQQQTPTWLSLNSASKHKARPCPAVPPAASSAARLSPLLVTELIPPSPRHAETNRPGCLPPWPPHGCHGDGRLAGSALIEGDFPPTASNKWSKITQPTRPAGAGARGPWGAKGHCWPSLTCLVQAQSRQGCIPKPGSSWRRGDRAVMVPEAGAERTMFQWAKAPFGPAAEMPAGGGHGDHGHWPPGSLNPAAPSMDNKLTSPLFFF